MGDRQPTGPANLQADPATSARRRDALKAYMDEHVLGPEGFCCASYAACRGSTRQDDRFFEGQLSHVGGHYDLHLDGRPLRVVVVGQEVGAPRKGVDPSHVSLDKRYQGVHERTGLERRYYADGAHEARNPHMRGPTRRYGSSSVRNWALTGNGSSSRQLLASDSTCSMPSV